MLEINWLVHQGINKPLALKPPLIRYKTNKYPKRGLTVYFRPSPLEQRWRLNAMRSEMTSGDESKTYCLDCWVCGVYIIFSLKFYQLWWDSTQLGCDARCSRIVPKVVLVLERLPFQANAWIVYKNLCCNARGYYLLLRRAYLQWLNFGKPFWHEIFAVKMGDFGQLLGKN